MRCHSTITNSTTANVAPACLLLPWLSTRFLCAAAADLWEVPAGGRVLLLHFCCRLLPAQLDAQRASPPLQQLHTGHEQAPVSGWRVGWPEARLLALV